MAVGAGVFAGVAVGFGEGVGVGPRATIGPLGVGLADGSRDGLADAGGVDSVAAGVDGVTTVAVADGLGSAEPLAAGADGLGVVRPATSRSG